MILKGKTLFVTLTLLFIVVSTQIIACNSGADILEDNIDQVEFIVKIDSSYMHDRVNYLYPNEEFEMEIIAKNPEKLPEKTTYVWTSIQTAGGNYFHEEAGVYDDVTDNSQYIYQPFENEGEYTVRCDLYDTEEYRVYGVTAPRLGTVERQFTVRAVNIDIKSELLGEGKYRFTPQITNPEIGPAYLGYHFDFGDGDLEILHKRSGDDITHEYHNEGTYSVVVELLADARVRGGIIATPIATSKITVEVGGSEFFIVTPSPTLKVGEDYIFRAMASGLLPIAPSYEWDFGDGTGKIIPFSNEVTHVFKEAGSHVIYVEVFESEEEASPQLGSAFIEVDVVATASHLEELHQMKRFSLDFAVQHDYVEGMSGVFLWDWNSFGEVVWDGVNFTMEWEQDNHSEKMFGSVSEDGTIIKQLKIRREFVDSKGNTEWYELETIVLPFWTDTIPDRFIVDKSGEAVKEFVPYFNTYRTAGYQWTKDARLYVKFEK